MPAVNWALMVACILLVVGFGSSSNLAAAYGIAVISTMTITSTMFFVVARERWHWSSPWSWRVVGVFLAIDLAFLGANIVKMPHGGWFPLVVAALGVHADDHVEARAPRGDAAADRQRASRSSSSSRTSTAIRRSACLAPRCS